MVGEIQEAAAAAEPPGRQPAQHDAPGIRATSKPKLDWCDVADLIQVTLKEIEKDLARHKVTVGLAAGTAAGAHGLCADAAGAHELCC